MKVVIQKNPEVKQDIFDIQIPDARHLAMSLPKADKEMVLELWNLCHSLRQHIRQDS